MRTSVTRALSVLVALASSGGILAALGACGGSTTNSSFGDGNDASSGGIDAGGGIPDGAIFGNDGGGGNLGSDGGGTTTPPDAGVVVTTTIYANTDDSLYSMDPATRAVALIGKFAGIGGGTLDTTVTDVAVDAAGVVFVNTESVVYKATLPTGAGAVNLTKVATIAAKANQRFYALAFAPAGVLGAGETLVGGDGNGELWAIDSSTGATRDLGSFGPVVGTAGASTFALSGDIVFYVDGNQKPTGLATIRSCKGTTCTKTNDYLAGIDMTALAAAYKSGTPAVSLLGGIYGGSASSTGNGTGHGSLFGLGAWEGDVYAFSRNVAGASATPPSLFSVDPATGAATALPGTFAFTNGWSGAGVTTKVTVTVPPPPPPPR